MAEDDEGSIVMPPKIVRRVGIVIDWRPATTIPPEMKDGVREIVALSPAYVGKDGKPAPIILRWFKYNGVEAWRDWDADPHFPTHWHPLADLPRLEK